LFGLDEYRSAEIMFLSWKTSTLLSSTTVKFRAVQLKKNEPPEPTGDWVTNRPLASVATSKTTQLKYERPSASNAVAGSLAAS
jgi:hypothetical protein